MTTDQVNRLRADLDTLHKRHTAHPAIILIQPKDSKQIFSFMVGSPGREWLCHVLDNELGKYARESFLMAALQNRRN